MSEDEIIAEEAKVNDAAEIMSVVKRIDAETDYMIRVTGEFALSPEDERSYIQRVRDGERSLLLVARRAGRIRRGVRLGAAYAEPMRRT